MMKDTVCGMDVSENKDSLRTMYEGKEFAFCSPKCRDKFEKEPQAFANKERRPDSFRAARTN